jgi:hypothetical protein
MLTVTVLRPPAHKRCASCHAFVKAHLGRPRVGPLETSANSDTDTEDSEAK